MSSRYYPIYQRGNPQLRVFLPNFWMKIVRPEEPLPPNMVLFQTSIEMTKYDVKNYLEKIYKVPVIDVRTTIKMGKIKNCFEKPNLIKEDDYKEALVTMPRGTIFEFPDFMPKDDRDKEAIENIKKASNKMVVKNKGIFGVPKWFS